MFKLPALRSVTLSRETRYLIAVRAVRSVGQGALVVDFALYLHALHWSAPSIGLLFMGALLFSSALTLIMGPLSDNRGRRHFLIGYEFAQLAMAVLALMSSNPMALAAAAIIGSFGHGLNGGAGPFSPVELAWLSATVEPEDRAAIYSLNTAVGFFGMALGALFATMPHFLHSLLPGPLAYRPLFFLVVCGAVAALYLLRRLPELAQSTAVLENPHSEATLTRTENVRLLKLFGINALNGLAVGFLGPLMAYWFAIRFHHGPLSIGPVMALALIVTGITSLFVGRITYRFGVLGSVLGMRLAGLVLLLLMPLVPTFTMAAVLYVVRSALNRGTVGARQALNIGLVRAHRRGLAASLSNVSTQIPRALGPVFAGLMYHAGFLALPFFIAGGFQAAYLIAYQRMFRDRTLAAADTTNLP
ncbi:MAG: MFS transporter [Acidiferrobacter sp.]